MKVPIWVVFVAFVFGVFAGATVVMASLSAANQAPDQSVTPTPWVATATPQLQATATAILLPAPTMLGTTSSAPTPLPQLANMPDWMYVCEAIVQYHDHMGVVWSGSSPNEGECIIDTNDYRVDVSTEINSDEGFADSAVPTKPNTQNLCSWVTQNFDDGPQSTLVTISPDGCVIVTQTFTVRIESK